MDRNVRNSLLSSQIGQPQEQTSLPTERTPMLRPRPHIIEIERMPEREEFDEMPFWQRVSSPLHPTFRKIQDHCHHQWVAALLSFITLVLLFLFVFIYSTPPRPEDCVTPFGELLGGSHGVLAFSNCNRRYQNFEEHFLLVKTSRVYSGVKWKSTEYARRFWLLAKHPGIQFISVKNAEEIWTVVGSAFSVDGKPVSLLKFANTLKNNTNNNNNNSSSSSSSSSSSNETLNKSISRFKKSNWKSSRPQPGDLLIYAKDERLPEGHVAVIVGVVNLSNTNNNHINNDNNLINNDNHNHNNSTRNFLLYLAEQNWDNKRWVNDTDGSRNSINNNIYPVLRNYSRTLLFQENEDTHTMEVEDPKGTILGWVRVSSVL